MEKIVLSFTVLLLLCASGVPGSDASADTPRLTLLTDLLLRNYYNPDVIPGTPLSVRSRLTLVNLLSVDTEANLVELVIWQEMQWTDKSLKWDPAEYDNITSIRLPVDKIWTPDLCIYNSVSPVQTLSPLIAVVSHDGSVLVVPSERIQFSCDLTGIVREGGAECPIKIGSWTYDGSQLTMEENPTFSMDGLMDHTEYEVLETSARKSTMFYDCCPEPYEDVTFLLTIRKKNFFTWF